VALKKGTSMIDATTKPRILLVEDDPGDTRLHREILRSAFLDFELQHALTLADGMQAIRDSRFDVVMLDLTLPDSFGLETVTQMCTIAQQTAIVVLTGIDDEALAIQAVQAGAKDFLQKGEIHVGVLGRCLRYAMERQRARRRDQQQLEQLARSNAQLQQFTSIASHDLQEPLRKVLAFGDHLRAACGDRLGPEGDDYLRRMQDAAARMRRLVETLLEYSRLSSRAPQLRAVDLNQTMVDVLARLESCLAKNDAVVQIDPLPTVLGDPSQLHQLFQNLVADAIKFHRPDEPPRIHIYAAPRDDYSGEPPDEPPDGADGWRRIAVQDNGLGIDEKFHDRVFEPFQRLHGREQYDGTGMGLTICRGIAEAHGGRLELQSLPGEGSTFTVTLPHAATAERRLAEAIA
jgi:signal transduction histidine kinase